jgi:hypothetical protein
MVPTNTVYRSTGRGGAGNFASTSSTPNQYIQTTASIETTHRFLFRTRKFLSRGIGGAGNFVSSVDVDENFLPSLMASKRAASMITLDTSRSYSIGIGGAGNHIHKSGEDEGRRISNDSKSGLL